MSAILTRSRDELATALASAPQPRAVVMTMGALHEGHCDLVRAAAERVGEQGTVIVTIFVNPLQFAAGEDLDSYPRDLEGDLATVSAALSDDSGALRVGRLVVFAPTPEVMYPHGEPQIRLTPGPMATVLEGATRPTHFAGVCQVVLTLLHLTSPQWAMFGRKDAQQLAIVRAMVRDLAVPVEIVPVDIRRERDGLAMSSRNAYLSPEQRQQALALSRSLAAGRAAAQAGADAAQVRDAVAASLTAADGVEVDYVAVVDPDTFEDRAGSGLGLPTQGLSTQGLPTQSLPTQDGQPGEATGSADSAPAAGTAASADAAAAAGAAAGGSAASPEAAAPAEVLVAVAAKVGTTRLIDNALIELRHL